MGSLSDGMDARIGAPGALDGYVLSPADDSGCGGFDFGLDGGVIFLSLPSDIF